MDFVDIVSRFGDICLRVTPMPDPLGGDVPAWSLSLNGDGPISVGLVAADDPEGEQTLLEFFAELQDERLGWDGRKHWQSRFAALQIDAEHDQVNTTRLYVELTGGPVPQWQVNVEMHVDPGVFAQIINKLEVYSEAVVTGEHAPERLSTSDKAITSPQATHAPPTGRFS